MLSSILNYGHRTGVDNVQDCASNRSLFVQDAATHLEGDARFVAAWLVGSFGRREADEFSDIDLMVVVQDDAARSLCERWRMTGAGTVDARREVLRQFGDPAIIHENHANAPPSGTFTTAVYRETGLIVDWTFVPVSGVQRGPNSVLLFDKIGVPVVARDGSASGVERVDRISERFAFFWMLAIPAAISLHRDDGVRFHAALEWMASALREIDFLERGLEPPYTRRSQARFSATPEDRRNALLELCELAEAKAASLTRLGADVPTSPEDALRIWMDE